MGLFSPVKKHANKFRYIPRYYDPEKERREQRRRELHGTSSQDDGEYTPGQYIRTQREARRAARSARGERKKMPSLTLWVLLATMIIVAYMLYPRIVAFLSTPSQPRKVEVVQEEFNPYTPITIVPNDYKEE